MKKIVLILLIALVASLQVKADNYASEILQRIYFDKGVGATTSMLSCDVCGTDTLWTITLFGNSFADNAVLVLKTADKQILTLELKEKCTIHTTLARDYSPETGEIVEYNGAEEALDFQLTNTALDYISQHGISKIRIETKLRLGTDEWWCEASWKRNEWGKSLSKAYRLLKEKMSPDYVPPKKPSIYDGF